jgi:membrane fusion protein, multidrug efflux system
MNRKHALGAAAAVTIITAGLWAWRAHSEAAPPETASSTPRAQEADAEPGVTLSAEARERAGIQTVQARAAELQAPVHAIATVLPLQELIDAAAAIATARSQVERAQAALEASRRDHERIKGLHAQDRNASDRALEAAEAVWRVDEAGAHAAAAALQAVQASARARWGAALADAMAIRGRLWQDLESGKQCCSG